MSKPLSILVIAYMLLAAPHITASDVETTKIGGTKPHTEVSEHKAPKKTIQRHRERRSLEDEEEKPFWANRGKKFASGQTLDSDDPESRAMENMPFSEDNLHRYGEKSTRQEGGPFWGNRGRRGDSSSMEMSLDEADIPVWPSRGRRELSSNNLLRLLLKDAEEKYKNSRQYSLAGDRFTPKVRREDERNPFWGNRGRRNSDENVDTEEEASFWDNREHSDEDLQFWAARGRSDEVSPFWGTRGKKDEENPFWGSRGKRDEVGPFWGNRGRRYDENFQNNLFDDLKNIKTELNGVTRQKRNPNFVKGQRADDDLSFWKNRGRNSELKYLFSKVKPIKGKAQMSKSYGHNFSALKHLRQDRLYADEPYFILVDRSSRSKLSYEDPYFITRGKKKIDQEKAARDRRGVVEEIVRSVQYDDPYFVMRGKKHIKQDENAKIDITKVRYDEFVKAKELVCSAIDIINAKIKDPKVTTKRELSDRDRNRRAILKKLAAQLENDPYFVSRGKKNTNVEIAAEKVQEFIKHVTDICS